MNYKKPKERWKDSILGLFKYIVEFEKWVHSFCHFGYQQFYQKAWEPLKDQACGIHYLSFVSFLFSISLCNSVKGFSLDSTLYSLEGEILAYCDHCQSCIAAMQINRICFLRKWGNTSAPAADARAHAQTTHTRAYTQTHKIFSNTSRGL